MCAVKNNNMGREVLVNFLIATATSLCNCLLSVFLSWYLIHRKDTIQKLKRQYYQKDAQLKDLQAESAADEEAEKRNARKIKKLQGELQQVSNSLSQATVLKQSIISIGLWIVPFFARSYFANKVCLRLPFVPAGWIGKITHRGIESDDLTEGSFNFILILVNSFLKPSLDKLLDFTLPASGFMGMLQGQVPQQQ